MPPKRQTRVAEIKSKAKRGPQKRSKQVVFKYDLDTMTAQDQESLAAEIEVGNADHRVLVSEAGLDDLTSRQARADFLCVTLHPLPR